MKIGDFVQVKEGASDWLKKRNFWLSEMPESVDGMIGVICSDYTYLPGDDCHYEVDIDGMFIGVHPKWLVNRMEQKEKAQLDKASELG